MTNSNVKYAEGFTVHRRAVPLPPGMNQYGYGNKITTDYTVKFEGDWRYYQVYVISFSNMASYYITRKGETLYIREQDLDNVQ